jgi:hypothetical protein
MINRNLRIVLHILSRHKDVLSIHRLLFTFVVQNWAVLRLRCSAISALNYGYRLCQSHVLETCWLRSIANSDVSYMIVGVGIDSILLSFLGCWLREVLSFPFSNSVCSLGVPYIIFVSAPLSVWWCDNIPFGIMYMFTAVVSQFMGVAFVWWALLWLPICSAFVSSLHYISN